MKKMILILFACLLSFPMQAFAYSYGDPTKEDIAETFKLVKSKIDASDWDGAHEAYKVRRAEISSHFGDSIAVTLDQNFKAKNKDALISNYRYVLYLNLERRFKYAKQDINDYAKAKLLLAKAKGTFDVLKPYVQTKVSGKVAGLDTSFDNALKALGNPGLFGVGEEPVQPELFEKETSSIISILKPIFPYAPAKAQAAPPPEEPKKPAKEEPKPTTQNTTTTKQEPKEASTQKTTSTASKEKVVAEEEKQQEAEMKETETTAEAAETSETAVAATAEAQEEAKEEQEQTGEEQQEETDSSVPTEDQEVATAHDPMERTTKTNPLVTVVIIGAVLVLGLGGVIFAKKKGFI